MDSGTVLEDLEYIAAQAAVHSNRAASWSERELISWLLLLLSISENRVY